MKTDGVAALDRFYNMRSDFQIVALTGLESSGCSYLASLMCNKKNLLLNVRKPSVIKVKSCSTSDNSELYSSGTKNDEIIQSVVFSRKYKICYDYIEKNYANFTQISYIRVTWLYVLLYLREQCKNNEDFNITYLYENLIRLLEDKFFASHQQNRDMEYKMSKGDKLNPMPDIQLQIKSIDATKLIGEINKIYRKDFLTLRGDDSTQIAEVFCNTESAFNTFIDQLTAALIKIDYYYLCYFYNRLSTVIRTFGNPLELSSKVADNRDLSHLYDIVFMIEVILRGIKVNNTRRGRTNCRVVIDSLRNSMESNYLKERYSAFYLIAIHSEDRERLLYKKVESKVSSDLTEKDIDLLCKTIKCAGDQEADNSSFEKGLLTHPNTSQCISDAEIHIMNPIDEAKTSEYSFRNTAEQWMKYAALILHPGLITPSAEERCMIVAYSAKLNSACLSRQVGAVITNSHHAIRTIGWNEVPYGQISCGLKDICSHIENKEDETGICYSEFEMDNETHYDDGSFRKSVSVDYNHIRSYKTMLNGLPIPYCFKTLDNRYTGEKNQVLTRALHAEENAMLQMVKYGGESLTNGIIYVTASPCELCSKKLYQIGVRKIVYIDAYPGIAINHIINAGAKRPTLKRFQGAYGSTYFKLFTPFVPLKNEITIRTNGYHELKSADDLLREIIEKKGAGVLKKNYTQKEYDTILSKVLDVKKETDRL